MVAVSYSSLHDANSPGDWVGGFAMAGLYGYGIVALWRMARNQRQVAFDDRFAYLKMRGHELLIPLENVKDIELKTMLGTYEVTLYHPEQFGTSFFFKVSLLYPLNHRQKELLIDRFWEAVERARKRGADLPRNALMS